MSGNNDDFYEDMITTEEAAKIMRRSPRTLQSWRRRPEHLRPIQHYHDGYRVMYRREEVVEKSKPKKG